MDTTEAQATDAAPVTPEATPEVATPATPAPETLAVAPVEAPKPPDPNATDADLANYAAQLKAYAEAQKAPETPAEPEPAVEPADTDPEAKIEPEPEPEKKPKRILPHRISPDQFSETDQKAMVYRKACKDAGQDITLKEAIEIIEAREAKQTPAPPPPNLDATQAKIDAIHARREIAFGKRQEILRATGQEDLAEWEKEEHDLEAEQTKATHELEQANAAQQQAAQVVRSARTEARDEALRIYPTAVSEETELGAMINEVIGDWQKQENPALSAPNAPLLVAHEAARQLATLQAQEKHISFAQAMTALMEGPKAAAPKNGATPPAQAPKAAPPKPKLTGGAPAAPIQVSQPLSIFDPAHPDSRNPQKLDAFMRAQSATSIT